MKKRAANDDAGFPRDDHQAVACADENACKHSFCIWSTNTSGQVGRPSASRGLPAMTGFLRGLQADSRAGCARDERGGRRSITPSRATKDANLQVCYGSDGTRTRDLRRDRPVLVVPA
jgi:hypothetical protein